MLSDAEIAKAKPSLKVTGVDRNIAKAQEKAIHKEERERIAGIVDKHIPYYKREQEDYIVIVLEGLAAEIRQEGG